MTVRRIALDCRVEGERRAVAEVSVRLVRAGEIVASAQGEWTLSKCWSASFGLDLEQGRHDRTFSARAAFCLGW